MAASSRSKLKELFQALQGEFKTDIVTLPKEREVLEHLVYATFLENTPFSAATKAFQLLEDYFVDWNELRVSTTRELVELLGILPFPERACERIRQTLQWIFRTSYKFDLEEWREKDANSFREFLKGIPFSTRFITDYLVRYLYGQGEFPFDEGALRIMRLLDLVEVNDENKEVVKGIDRIFSRQNAETFFILLHQLSAEMMKDSESKKIKKLLKKIDPESEFRSWIPLVESDDDKDPSLIAKSMVAKVSRHPVRFELDESELLDDSDDMFVEGTDDELSEEIGSFQEETEGEFYVSKDEIADHSVPSPAEKDARGKKGTGKKSDAPSTPPKESVAKRSGKGSEPVKETKAPKETKGLKEGKGPKEEKGSKGTKDAKEDKGGKVSKSVKDEKGAKDLKKSEKGKKTPEPTKGKEVKPAKKEPVALKGKEVKPAKKGTEVEEVKSSKSKKSIPSEKNRKAEAPADIAKKKKPETKSPETDSSKKKMIKAKNAPTPKVSTTKTKTPVKPKLVKGKSGQPPEKPVPPKRKINVIEKPSPKKGNASGKEEKISKTNKLKQKKPR